MPEPSPSDSAQGDGHDALAETSKKLLETLNELAGPEDVRIEDTGVEWRVLSEADAAKAEYNLTDTSDTGSMLFDEDVSDSDDEEVLPTVHEEPGNTEQPSHVERRYDDNTPLPEDYDDDSDEYSPPPPQRRETDLWQESTMFDELQGDLALSEPDEWTDLLEEVGDADSIPAEVEEELVAIHSQLSSRDDRQPDDRAAEVEAARNTASQSAVPVDLDTQFELQAEALGITGEQKIIDEKGEKSLQDELTDEMPLLDGEYAAAADLEEPVAEEHIAHEEHIAGEAVAGQQLADEPTAVGNMELAADEAYTDEEEDDDDALEYDLSDEYDNEDDGDLALYAAAEADADLQLEDDIAAESEHDETHPDDAHASVAGDLDDDEPEHADAEDDIDDRALAESTGEFEAQIEVAADALKQTDDDQGDTEIEPGEIAVADEDEEEDEEEDEDILLEESDAEDLLDDVEQISHKGIDEPVVDLAVADEVDDDTNDDADNDLSRTRDDDDFDKGDDEDSKSEKLTDDELVATVFGADQASKFFDENSGEVETIIMEGEFIRSALEKERLEEERQAQANIQEASKLADTYAMNREKMRSGRRGYNPPAYLMLIGVALLGIALVAQIVHASRDSLATSDLFNSTVAPVYRLLGRPITPQWDIKGWQFESTSGSTDEEEAALTVVSRIANYADVPLPYPLVHISLTDRWEEIIGSRVLEPDEYLAGNIDPSRPVTPGEDFTAVITIDNPSADATGFKLNVCYRVVPGRVRCAIEDFKD